MNIVFFCQSCGARFEVPPASAGKKGRCKKCGQMMAIPRVQQVASMAAMPALAGAGDGDAMGWLAEANTNVGLKPLTVENVPVLGSRRPIKPRVEDDLGDGNPYELAKPVRAKQGSRGRSGGGAASGLKIAWRQELGGVQKFFRKINETAYLISVPFLMMILLGAIVHSRPLALFGATFVVLLNLGRIASGLANILVIPFREGPAQGVLFLVPPFTFLYMRKHWGKLRKPTMRVVTPILTIGLVVVVFTFIPALGHGRWRTGPGGIAGQLRHEAGSLKGEMIDEVKKVKSVDVEQLGGQAVEKVRDVGGRINSIGGPAPGPGNR